VIKLVGHSEQSKVEHISDTSCGADNYN